MEVSLGIVVSNFLKSLSRVSGGVKNYDSNFNIGLYRELYRPEKLLSVWKHPKVVYIFVKIASPGVGRDHN